MSSNTSISAVLLAMALSSAIACARDTRPGPDVYDYAVADATVDPDRIERAPRTAFRGTWAHWLDGRWYVRTASGQGEGWAVFVEVPPELRRLEDSIATENTPTSPTPRGPSVQRAPGAVGGPFAFPPPSR